MGFTTVGDAPLQTYASSIGKDSKLLSNFQIKSSKMVGENGEPMVVYHQTNSTKYSKIVFVAYFLRIMENGRMG